MNLNQNKIILSCFAGRKKNMELLLAYTDKLYELNLLDEVHIWNFSKNYEDEIWLKETFQTSDFFSTSDYNYQKTDFQIFPNNNFELLFKCSRDAHILISDSFDNSYFEISLGAYDNSCCFLRDNRQGENLDVFGDSVCNDYIWKKLSIVITDNGNIEIKIDDKIILKGCNSKVVFPLFLSFAGWSKNENINWFVKKDVEQNRKHKYARLFNVKNKRSWLEYYKHYTKQLYNNCVIIKCDDDIVFIDVSSFKNFIEHRKQDQESILMFPNIVNNGICAYHQYQMNYLPLELGQFKQDHVCGRLWGDGLLCEKFHENFIKNYAQWIEKSKNINKFIKLPIGSRVSINFFAILSKDLYVYQMIGNDDEKNITIDVSKKLNRCNCINMEMIVSHLAFYKQRQKGLDENKIIDLYQNLKNQFLG